MFAHGNNRTAYDRPTWCTMSVRCTRTGQQSPGTSYTPRYVGPTKQKGEPPPRHRSRSPCMPELMTKNKSLRRLINWRAASYRVFCGPRLAGSDGPDRCASVSAGHSVRIYCHRVYAKTRRRRRRYARPYLGNCSMRPLSPGGTSQEDGNFFRKTNWKLLFRFET